ncbi:MAG TPA: hypothetical protein VM221_00505 [Armatimonadota bacterium]|nr:hypothetical protein [Armatimonadota bacterium]
MSGKGFGADEMSVVLAHFLEQELRARPREIGELMRRAPPRAHEQLARLLVSRSGELSARIPAASGTSLRLLFADAGYLARVAEMAWQRLRAGADAPALRIAPQPLDASAVSTLLAGRTNLALIFAAEAVCLQDTLETLHADERRWREREEMTAESRAPGINLLAVHAEWLMPGGATRRALVVDHGGMANEVMFDSPVPIHAAEVLHLPTDGEQELHRELSRYCAENHILEINPYPAAERADDKFRAHTLWRQRGVTTPQSWLFARSLSPGEVAASLRGVLAQMGARGRRQALYLQPNRGTEGQGVARVEAAAPDLERLGSAHPAVAAIGRLGAVDDALVREERGDTRFRHPGDGGLRRIAFRVNVGWDGKRFVAESGFAQVAADETADAASRGRGGSIVPVADAMASLWRRGARGWRLAAPAGSALQPMKCAAVAAAEALNADLCETAFLKHLGIDIVLESRGGRLAPVVLEANARPAGLAHAAVLESLPATPATFTIGTAVFGFLSRIRGLWHHA